MPKGDKLTPKQRRFVDAIIEGAGPSEGYRAAYDASGMKATAVAKEANRLLNHPVIAPILKSVAEERDQAQKAATQRTADRLKITKERHLEMLARRAYGDLRQLASWHEDGTVLFLGSNDIDDDAAAMVAGIEKVVSPKGAESTKLKTHNALAAADQIAKLMGWYAPEAAAGGGGAAPLNLNIHIVPPAKE